MPVQLKIRLSDIYRATMPEESGNEGYIGVAKDGSGYHVVVPVDRLIARGLRFWERPQDGTPFGGYSNLLYFPCLTYKCEPGGTNDYQCRLAATLSNAALLRHSLASLNIKLTILEDLQE